MSITAKILDCLEKMTKLTDRQRIDTLLTELIGELTSATRCEILHRTTHLGQDGMRINASWSTNLSKNTGASPVETANFEKLKQFPALIQCLKLKNLFLAELINDDNEVRLWIPGYEADRQDVTGYVRLTLGATHHTTLSELGNKIYQSVKGILAIHHNFTKLLDDNEHDSLTGLLNRKTFDRRFTELVSTFNPEQLFEHLHTTQPERRAIDSENEHWLAVIDIDHFKTVNDQFGHVYGDEVLILLANILKVSFRDQDRVYRFGGEEFVVLLRSTSLDHARKSFERLRAKVESHPFPQIKAITISLGFVRISKDTPVSVLGHADQALYFAKKNGRNQICLYEELVNSGRVEGQLAHECAEFF